eukprot:7824327-Pyramimonas_sp.AAC.1
MSGAANRGTGGAPGRGGAARLLRCRTAGSTPPGATCKWHSASNRAPAAGAAATVGGVAARGTGRPRARPPG